MRSSSEVEGLTVVPSAAVFTSILSSIRWGSCVGHASSSCDSHCGPLHQTSLLTSLVPEIPLVARSAGLSFDGTYFQVTSVDKFCICVTLFAIKTGRLHAAFDIHANVTLESDHATNF